ncbi:MAG TPA: hypothetical protein PLU30_12660 [Verrucomicrobiae bacterium]|nr:hypothetical protein [Verrucomicrobiae bacterium]
MATDWRSAWAATRLTDDYPLLRRINLTLFGAVLSGLFHGK